MGDANIAHVLLESRAIVLRPHDPFVGVSGTKIPAYCDNRILLSHPAQRTIVNNAIYAAAQRLHFDVIAGTATSGIPWAAWLAERTGKPMVYVSKTLKGYGKGKLIEGDLQEGQHVLLVEDLITTGGSALRAIAALREAGAKVTDCIAIVTHEILAAHEDFTSVQCALHTLTTLTELLSEARAQKIISASDEQLVRTWQRDPQSWRTP